MKALWSAQRDRLGRQIQAFEAALVQNIYEIQKEGSALTELVEELERKYLSDDEIRDDYMEDFLKWYEDQQEGEDGRSWHPHS